MKLYALYLGGRAPGCHIEVHDVIFAVGKSLKALYPKILERWFGQKDKCHIDSWVVLSQIDDYNITLSTEPPNEQPESLFFINLGGYEAGNFTELHAIQFVVAAKESKAKKRSKATLLVGKDQVHTDDLYDVDDCIRLEQVDGYYIHLTKNHQGHTFNPKNAYHKIPKAIVSEYLNSKTH